jgi:hypothetical protein
MALLDTPRRKVANQLLCLGVFELVEITTSPRPSMQLVVNLSDKRQAGVLSPTVIDDIGNLLHGVAGSMLFDLFADIPRVKGNESFVDRVEMLIEKAKRIKLYDASMMGGSTFIGQVVKDPDLVRGQTCLLIDEMIADGETTLAAIRALERMGIEVTDVLVLVDCEHGGKEMLEKEGYALSHIFTADELLLYFDELGIVPSMTINEIEGCIHTEVAV